MGMQNSKYLVAGYPFEGNANDIKGANNGTVFGATFLDGKIGKAANFDGVNDNIIISDNSVFSFTDGTNDKPFSISFWVKFNSTTSRQWIVSKRDTTLTNVNEWQVALHDGTNGNKISFILWKNDASANLWAQTNASITAGAWAYICCTYDGSKTYAGIKIYFNTILQATTNKSTGSYAGMSNTNSPVVLGFLKNVPNTFFGGQMDLLKFHNKALTQSEIQRDYLNLPIL